MLAFGEAGHEDDGYAGGCGTRLDLLRGLEPVHPRHDGIHQDEIWYDVVEQVQRRLPRRGDQNGHFCALQHGGQHAQCIGLVVHDEDRVGVAGYLIMFCSITAASLAMPARS